MLGSWNAFKMIYAQVMEIVEFKTIYLTNWTTDDIGKTFRYFKSALTDQYLPLEDSRISK